MCVCVCVNMSKVQILRALVKQRLTAAAEDIFGLFERTIAEYEETLCRSKEENERQRRLLDAVFNPQLRLHRADIQLLVSKEEVPSERQEWSPSVEQEDPEPPYIKEEQNTEADGEDCGGPEPARNSHPDTHLTPDTEDEHEDSSETDVSDGDWEETREREPQSVFPANVQQLLVNKEEVLQEQQEWSPSVEQEDPEPPHIKEEQEEVWTSQEGEQLQGLEEADITEFPFTPVPVKSDDDEKKLQSSQLHQRQTEQMEMEADGEDCGGPESARNSHPDAHLQPDDKTRDSSETDVSDGDWEETREPHSGFNAQMINNDVSVSDAGCKTVKKLFSCSECGKRWDCQADLTVHMRVHTGERPFRCSFCGKGFSQKANLRRHTTCHTGEKPFSCSVCKKRFRHGGYIVKHMKIHTREKLFTLQSHTMTHTEEKPFSCPFCDRSFTKNVHLMRHVSVHIGKEGFSCSVCDRRFSRYKLLKIHTCFGRQYSQLHQNQTEENREPPTSSSTEQMGTTADGEDCGGPEPAKNAHPDTYLTPDMTECSARTDISNDAREETRKHWSGLNSQVNDKILVSNEGTNTVKKSVSCSECGKRFKNSAYLKTHLRVHTGEKPFRCSFCGTGFSQKANLFRHVTRHTGEKPFSCIVCKRLFRHRGAVVRHMRTHAEEKPFSCPFCDKGFTQEVSLMRHVSVHIGETSFTCSVCDKTFSDYIQLKTHKCFGEFSQFHQSQTEENRDPPTSSSTEQTGTEADGEDCGGPERSAGTDVCDGDWEDNREPQSGSNSQNNNEVPVSDKAADRPLSCSDCGRTFNRKYCLTIHMRTHTGEKPYGCSVCGRRFTQKINLKRHAPIHLRERGFSCKGCDKRFTRNKLLKTHKCVGKSLQLHQILTEDNREAEPPGSSSTEHMKTEADGEDCGQPQPDADDKTGDSSENEVSHGDWEKTRKPQSGVNSLKNDVSVSDVGCNTDKKPFSCSECGKGWGCQADLNVHMRVHTGERPFRCSVCAKGFSQKANLVRHMTCHTGEKPFSCSVCKKCFRYKGDLVRHMKIHMREKLLSRSLSEPANSDDWKETREPQSGSSSHNNNEVPVSDETAGKSLSCSDCGKTFSRRYCLNIHRRLHTGERPFSCSICGKHFNQRNTFSEHMKRHTGQDTFNCSLCGKKFGYKFRLKEHMRTHTGEKPFCCSVCGKGFRYNGELIAHMRRHSGEKPFSCSVCHKTFRLKSMLKDHMKVHTGEKPFSCSVCGQRFTQLGNLGKHMMLHM